MLPLKLQAPFEWLVSNLPWHFILGFCSRLCFAYPSLPLRTLCWAGDSWLLVLFSKRKPAYRPCLRVAFQLYRRMELDLLAEVGVYR